MLDDEVCGSKRGRASKCKGWLYEHAVVGGPLERRELGLRFAICDAGLDASYDRIGTQLHLATTHTQTHDPVARQRIALLRVLATRTLGDAASNGMLKERYVSRLISAGLGALC